MMLHAFICLCLFLTGALFLLDVLISHFTLYTLHSTLHTLHYIPRSALHTLHFTLHTLHFTLFALLSALHTLHFTFSTPHLTLYTPHSTIPTSLYTLHSLLNIPLSSRPTLFTPSSAFHSLQCTGPATGEKCTSLFKQLVSQKCSTWLHSGSWAASCFLLDDPTQAFCIGLRIQDIVFVCFWLYLEVICQWNLCWLIDLFVPHLTSSPSGDGPSEEKTLEVWPSKMEVWPTSIGIYRILKGHACVYKYIYKYKYKYIYILEIIRYIYIIIYIILYIYIYILYICIYMIMCVYIYIIHIYIYIHNTIGILWDIWFGSIWSRPHVSTGNYPNMAKLWMGETLVVPRVSYCSFQPNINQDTSI